MRQTATASPEPHDPYAAIAEYYDLEHDTFADDLTLIHELVETVGDPVVELGCGSGRILAGIADLGMRLTGVDASEAMLSRCRARAALHQAEVTLVQADMAATGLEAGRFGVALIGLSSLLHATTPDCQRAVLAEARRLLDPRGMLFVDLPNPLAGTFDHADGQVLREGHWTTESGESVVKFSSRSVDRVQHRVATEVWYDTTNSAGTVTRAQASFEMRYILPAELDLMLEMSGFVEWQVYGTYELDPFTESSPRLIVTAEKSASS